jgi:hypothetical protein
MGEALDGYIADRDAEGWNTKLVDVYDIYQAYGYGMATPSAITDYLDDAKEMGYTHVQLVGAASYDYRDYLGLGSVSFIPSIYQRTAGIINYTPCDSCLVMDESLKPAAAVGRWPVHSPAELQAVINKGRAWANGQSSAHTSLLIADANEGRNDYIRQVEETTKQLLETDGWNAPARVYLDDAIAAAVGDVDAGQHYRLQRPWGTVNVVIQETAQAAGHRRHPEHWQTDTGTAVDLLHNLRTKPLHQQSGTSVDGRR